MISALVATLALRQSFNEIPYRWRSLVLGGSPVSSIALPTKGRRVFVAAGVGFTFRDLAPSDRIPMARVTGVAIGDYLPETVVAVGEAPSGGNLRFSLDGGETWRPCPNPPAVAGGSVAVSSIGMTWVWSASDGSRWTEDYGFTWSFCSGLPRGAVVVADRTSSRIFYAVAEGRLYVSEDGARSFEAREDELPEGDAPVEIVPTPGRAGELWLLTRQGLYRALPGRSFAQVPGVTDPVALSFGLSRRKNVPGPLRFSAFLEGRVRGRRGLYRLDEEVSDWAALDNAPESVTGLAGDPSHEGRIYVCSREGGLSVGEHK